MERVLDHLSDHTLQFNLMLITTSVICRTKDWVGIFRRYFDNIKAATCRWMSPRTNKIFIHFRTRVQHNFRFTAHNVNGWIDVTKNKNILAIGIEHDQLYLNHHQNFHTHRWCRSHGDIRPHRNKIIIVLIRVIELSNTTKCFPTDQSRKLIEFSANSRIKSDVGWISELID